MEIFCLGTVQLTVMQPLTETIADSLTPTLTKVDDIDAIIRVQLQSMSASCRIVDRGGMDQDML